MTERIRWQDTPVGTISGHVGTIEQEAFAIWKPPRASGEWVLESDLPGLGGARCYGDDPDALKAEAERWLAGFVSSLGVVFADEPGTMFEDVSESEAFEEEFRARHAPGRRVRFSRPGAGYPGDQEMAARVLTPGEVYTIEWSDIGFSSSRLGLAGIESGLGFNSVLFEPVDDETNASTTAREKD